MSGTRSYGIAHTSGQAKSILGDVHKSKTIVNNTHIHLPNNPLLINASAEGRRIHPTFVPSSKSLAVLVLDGGVVGGLSDLYTLQHFMELVAILGHFGHVPKPCDFFDIIHGTGVGGLLAVLLGSLELTIEEAIDKYRYIYGEILGDVLQLPNEHVDRENFTQKLVKSLQQVLRECDMSEERLLEDSRPTSCKVALQVCEARREGVQTLRSYNVRGKDDARLKHVKLWQAVQATYTVHGITDPVDVKTSATHNVTYVSRKEAYQRLFAEAYYETSSVFLDMNQQLNDHLDCLVSIGPNFLTDFHGSESNYLTVSSEMSMLHQKMYADFAIQHAQLASSGCLCRLQFSFGYRHSIPLENQDQDHLAIQQSVDNFLKSPDVRSHMLNCATRAASHHVFALSNIAVDHLTPSHERVTMLQIADKISNYDARLSHWRRSFKRIRNTCLWIFQDSTFQHWLRTNDTSLLSCVGTVGCGKSFLIATIVDHFNEIRSQKLQVCIHFFFDAGKSGPESLVSLLLALIKQIIIAREVNMEPLSRELQLDLRDLSAEAMTPSFEKVRTLFQRACREFSGALYLIDGYDDMSETQIQEFFVLLRTLMSEPHLQTSKIIISSRETLGRGIDAQKQLRHLTSIFHIRLDINHLTGDIHRFVDALVEEQQLMRHITDNIQLVEEIKSILKAKGDKMFLWIYFQVQMIWQSSEDANNDVMIRKLLTELPDGLDDTYVQCLKRIKYKTIAQKAFKWIASTNGRLSPRQLREAVSMDSDKVELREGDILNSPVTDYCSNLISYDETGREVDFIHVSVLQFLRKEHHALRDELKVFVLDRRQDNLWCLVICLSYLLKELEKRQVVLHRQMEIPNDLPQTILGFVSNSPTWNILTQGMIGRKKNLPALRVPAVSRTHVYRSVELEIHKYILANWLDHARDLDGSDSAYSLFTRVCVDLKPDFIPISITNASPVVLLQALAQHAIMVKHRPLLRFVISHVNSRSKQFRKSVFDMRCPGMSSPLLHLASALGDTDAVRLLCPISSPELYDSDGKTALAWAIAGSHWEVVFHLMSVASSSITNCQEIVSAKTEASWKASRNRIVLPMTALLLDKTSADDFWFLIKQQEDTSIACLRSNALTYTWFTACMRGHWDVAHYLQQFKEPFRQTLPCVYPLSAYHGIIALPLDHAIRQGNEVLRIISIGLKIEDLPLWAAEKTLTKVLTLTANEQLLICNLFCGKRSIEMLRTTHRADWHRLIWSSCTNLLDRSSITQRAVVREVLHYEKRYQHVRNRTTMLAELDYFKTDDLWEFWEWLATVPDDILVLLVEMQYLGKFQMNQSLAEDRYRLNCDDLVCRFAKRVSSRALAALNLPSQHTSWHQPQLLGLAQSVGATAAQEYIAEKISLRGGDLRDDIRSVQELCAVSSMLAKAGPPSAMVASRCLRLSSDCDGKAAQLYLDLCKAWPHREPDADFSLNFPAGYCVQDESFRVKPGIKHALYRWNWRLRRSQGKPLSVTDIHFLWPRVALSREFGLQWI